MLKKLTLLCIFLGFGLTFTPVHASTDCHANLADYNNTWYPDGLWSSRPWRKKHNYCLYEDMELVAPMKFYISGVPLTIDLNNHVLTISEDNYMFFRGWFEGRLTIKNGTIMIAEGSSASSSLNFDDVNEIRFDNVRLTSQSDTSNFIYIENTKKLELKNCIIEFDATNGAVVRSNSDQLNILFKENLFLGRENALSEEALERAHILKIHRANKTIKSITLINNRLMDWETPFTLAGKGNIRDIYQHNNTHVNVESLTDDETAVIWDYVPEGTPFVNAVDPETLPDPAPEENGEEESVEEEPLVSVLPATLISFSKEQQENGGNHASNAVDGDEETRWAAFTHGFHDWIVVDLGDSHTIERVEIDPYKGRNYQYEIEYSDSPDNDFFQVSDLRRRQANSGRLTGSFSPVQARYVKLRVTDLDNPGGNSGWTSLYEFKVFGTTP